MTAFIILQTMDPFAPFYAMGCLLSTSIIHTFVEMDEKEERDREIGSFKRMAYRDSLTDVRNNAAYTESKILLDQLVKNGSLKDFGVVIFDINNLKTVNDTLGHEAGDKYIQNGCKLICNTFKHSPVFRIGGDEFIAILEGEDYRERGVLVTLFNDKVENNIRNGGVAVACGMSAFDPATDKGFDDVFERADRKMLRITPRLPEAHDQAWLDYRYATVGICTRLEPPNLIAIHPYAPAGKIRPGRHSERNSRAAAVEGRILHVKRTVGGKREPFNPAAGPGSIHGYGRKRWSVLPEEAQRGVAGKLHARNIGELARTWSWHAAHLPAGGVGLILAILEA